MDTDPRMQSGSRIACTLGPIDLASRMDDWQRIGRDCGLGREVAPGRVILRFHDAPEVGEQLAGLVDAERQCCALLDWQLVHDSDEWRVEVGGTDDELHALFLSR